IFAGATGWALHMDEASRQGVLAISALPVVLQVGCLLLLHSLMQYWLHRAGHQWAVLWRLHRIHHTDTMLDATTGLRHHPLESVVEYIPLLCLILILTPSAAGVLGFLALNIAFALFTHMNPACLPARLDRALAHFIMTPRLHRLHHSTWQPETDTNYGNILVIWDRLFGTFLAAPDNVRAGFLLGLDSFPAQQAQDPFALIASAFLPADPAGETAKRD
ncbi:MAG: hypothetical protein RLZZ437_2199, partial [Pseudomonadota bacterium]